MNIYISGGCKNGKSSYAQRAALCLAGNGPHYYLATMISSGDEDNARIRRHLSEREGLGFETVECGRDLAGILPALDPNGTVLVDSVTALLLNEMYPASFSEPPAADAAERTVSELIALARSVKHTVFVSDTIFSDLPEFSDETEVYRKNLADTDRKLASFCDTVVECCASNLICYKGELP